MIGRIVACLGLICLVFLCPVALAEEDDVVAQLLKADESTFAALAARDEPDPWVVAARLAGSGRSELAARFAGVKPRPATRGLLEFLASDPPYDEQVRLVRDRVLLRLADDATTRPMLAADLRAIDAVLDAANRLERAQLLGMRGFVQVYLGEVEAGQKDFLAAGAGARKLRWLRGAADALGTASENARVLYRHDEAVALARRDLALRWELNHKETALLHLRRLTELQSEMGDVEQAVEELQPWIKRLGKPVQLDLAGHLLRIADPEGAYALVRNDGSGRGHMLAGDSLRQLGREADALLRYRAAATKYEQEKDALRLGNALGNAGISLVRQGSARMAIPLLERAQNQFDEARNRGLVALAVLHRGDAHLAASQAPVALRLYNTARTYAARTNDSWLESEAHVRRGRALLALNDIKKARKSFTACGEIAKELQFHELSAAAALGEARCYLRQGRPRLAASSATRGRHSLAPLIEGVPVPVGDEARRLFDELAAVAVAAEMELGSDRDLWTAIERQRLGLPCFARAQLKSIRDRALQPGLRAEEDELRRSITRLSLWEDRARQEDDRAKAVHFKAERQSAERRLRSFVEGVQLRGRPGWELLFPRPAALLRVRERLGRDEALVSIATAGSRAVALVLTRVAVQRVDLGKTTEPLLDALGTATMRVHLVAPPNLQRLAIPAKQIVRTPSATEFGALRGRKATTGPIILTHPPSSAVLRELFLDGSLSVLAPTIPVAKTQSDSMRKKLENNERIELPRTSNWSWWGKAP